MLLLLGMEVGMVLLLRLRLLLLLLWRRLRLLLLLLLLTQSRLGDAVMITLVGLIRKEMLLGPGQVS